jgi:hypothetical protein
LRKNPKNPNAGINMDEQDAQDTKIATMEKPPSSGSNPGI